MNSIFSSEQIAISVHSSSLALCASVVILHNNLGYYSAKNINCRDARFSQRNATYGWQEDTLPICSCQVGKDKSPLSHRAE